MTAFRPHRGFERQIKQTARYRLGLREAAESVKRNAEAIARQNRDTGHYAASFVIDETTDGYAVGNTDIAAHLIEWGSANNVPRAPLRRAVRAAGLDLRETR